MRTTAGSIKNNALLPLLHIRKSNVAQRRVRQRLGVAAGVSHWWLNGSTNGQSVVQNRFQRRVWQRNQRELAQQVF